MRKTALRKVSKKRARENREYMAKRKVFLEANPTCQFPGCWSYSHDIHHIAKRGKLLCDPRYFLAVCRTHHTYIHGNPAWSVKHGFLLTVEQRRLLDSAQ